MGKLRVNKPVTTEQIEDVLDTLAWIMSKSDNAHLGVPLYERLERELEKLRRTELVLERARERAKRALTLK